MNERPNLVGIILCELVLQDVIRRDAISCINIHSGILAQAFPTQIPLIYAFAQLTNVFEKFEYQFKVSDPNGDFIAESPLTPVEPMPNENVTHKIINAFTGLTFNEEGSFKISLWAGGAEIGHLPFQVVLLPQQAVV